MPSYILSNANRFYVALEQAYGQVAAISKDSRFQALRLQAHQILEQTKRLDKTGTRSFLGRSATPRRRTAYELSTIMTSWSSLENFSLGAFFQAGLGAIPTVSQSATVAAQIDPVNIQTVAPHGLTIGSAVSSGKEIRFLSGVSNPAMLTLNAPFSHQLQSGSVLLPTLTFRLASSLPSLTIYDYWDPISTLSRLLRGASVATLLISVDGDYHQFHFSGPAADLLDSKTPVDASAGITSFPPEPVLDSFNYVPVPGHLGQVWLGAIPRQFFTLTEAKVQLKNQLELRDREFGSCYPKAAIAGPREVRANFGMWVQDDDQTQALYAVAKQGGSIPVMLQLGQQTGQLMGVYLRNVELEMPIYDDSSSHLQWKVNSSRAKGTCDDELILAFA